jgi:hypothetical protein
MPAAAVPSTGASWGSRRLCISSLIAIRERTEQRRGWRRG